MALQGQVTNENQYISLTRVAMATKLGVMITYLNRLLPEKIMYLPMSAKLGKVVTYHEKLPLIQLIPHSRGFVRSRDDLNTLYLHLTYQRNDITQGAPTHKFQ